jgi:hypothetical protein
LTAAGRQGTLGAVAGAGLVRTTKDDWIRSAKLALLSFAIMPLAVLIHELGHFSIAILCGLPAQLHAASVSGGAALGRAPGWMVACQTGAGPLASLLMSIGGALLYSRDRRRLWALALAVSAASRFLMPTAYLGARLLFLLEGRIYAAHPVFDEHDFAMALGLPPLLVAGAATLFLFGLVSWLLRQTEKGRRLPFALALIAGIGAALTVWIAITPPILLSYPGR